MTPNPRDEVRGARSQRTPLGSSNPSQESHVKSNPAVPRAATMALLECPRGHVMTEAAGEECPACGAPLARVEVSRAWIAFVITEARARATVLAEQPVLVEARHG